MSRLRRWSLPFFFLGAALTSCADGVLPVSPNGAPVCAADAECIEGQLCIDGECRSPCRSSQECRLETPVCEEGRCRALAAGEDCAADADCAPGTCLDHVCRPPCQSHDGCPSEAPVCEEGRCRALAADEDCVAEADCALGTCLDHVCQLPCLSSGDCPPQAPICEASRCRAAADDDCLSDGDCVELPGDPGCARGSCEASRCVYAVLEDAVCQAALCLDGFKYAERRCDAAGSCAAPVPAGVSCEGFACADAVDCKTSCSGPADCAASLSCLEGGLCASPSPLGAGCAANGECASGLCAATLDGGSVCCEQACDGACQACGANGVCDQVRSAPGCGGECDGAADGTECGSRSCSGLVLMKQTCQAGQCAGPAAAQDCTDLSLCAPGLCSPAGCTHESRTSELCLDGALRAQDPSGENSACNDGVDQDGNGVTDCLEPECDGVEWNIDGGACVGFCRDQRPHDDCG